VLKLDLPPPPSLSDFLLSVSQVEALPILSCRGGGGWGNGEKSIDSKKRGLFYFFLPMDEISSKRMKEATQFVLGYSTCKLNLFELPSFLTKDFSNAHFLVDFIYRNASTFTEGLA
jgi:hypothetical protein